MLLLDTHALLWWLADDAQLPRNARRAIRNEEVVRVSAGTVWEIAIKRGLGKLDITDAYSTDGDLRKFDLVLLEDDRRFFPGYLAMPLVRAELSDSAKRVLEELAGTMTQEEMQSLNQSVQEKKSLRDTWYPVIEAENALHRQWFDLPANRNKFKTHFCRFIELRYPVPASSSAKNS